MLWTAFILGTVGSLHCLGMCGPLVLAISFKGNNGLKRASNAALYNTGRIVTYMLMGAVLGLLGTGVRLAGFQQHFSILIGALILLFVVLHIVLKSSKPVRFFSAFQLGFVRVKYFLQQQLSRGTRSNNFIIGLLNGLLPCGLVYTAFAGALLSDSLQGSVLYMLVFGLGTAPALLGLALLKHLIRPQWGRFIKKGSYWMTMFIGVLFVLRGLNLGIPYISPQVNEEQTVVRDCCAPQQDSAIPACPIP